MKYELTIAKAADMLGVSHSRISQLIASGVLESVTIRGNRRISKESVEHYRDVVRRTGRPPKTVSGVQRFVLMSADYPIMTLEYDATSDLPFSGREVLDPDRAPWGVVTRGGSVKRRELNQWWRGRSIPDVRPGLGSKLIELGAGSAADIPLRNRGLSLSDCYWLKPVDASDDLRWEDVNYFDNAFAQSGNDEWDGWLDEVGLDSPDNTSEGALPKKWVISNGKPCLLKGCHADDQRPFNEVVATSLHRRLLAPDDYVAYSLVDTADGPACACRNFLRKREEYVPAAYVKDTLPNIKGATLFDRFCKYAGRLGMDELMYRQSMAKMIICDALLANTDRHWRNFGFIRNVDTLEMRPAPIFDSGNCLWFDKTVREVQKQDWTFAAKPFGPEPDRQLALVDDVSWFDPGALACFVDEAAGILCASKHANAEGRLDFVLQGLDRQVSKIVQLAGVIRYRA